VCVEVAEELLEVAEELPSFGEVVVGQHYVGYLLGNIGASYPHGNADVRLPYGRRVVHTVAHHRDGRTGGDRSDALHFGDLLTGCRRPDKRLPQQNQPDVLVYFTGETPLMQDLFLFDQTGIQNGRVVGMLKSTGLRPRFAEKFAINNIELPTDIFNVGTSL
jgi:hypothetical protein